MHSRSLPLAHHIHTHTSPSNHLQLISTPYRLLLTPYPLLLTPYPLPPTPYPLPLTPYPLPVHTTQYDVANKHRIELSLIQKEWSIWDSMKLGLSQLPPPPGRSLN